MVVIKLDAASEEELDNKLNIYFDAYPREGYMTRVSDTYYDHFTNKHVTIVTRLQSCD